jgi:hypothetical protein
MELLRPLAEEDDGTTATGTVQDITWDRDGRLVVSCEASWQRSTDDRPLFRLTNGQLWRVLPPALAAALPESVQDVTDELGTAIGDITYHLRGKGQPEIGIDSEAEVTTRALTPEEATVTQRVVGTLDVSQNTYGQRLSEGTYDFSLRVGFMGMLAHSRLRSRHIVRPALIDNKVAIAYSDRSDRLALHIGTQLSRLFDTTSADVERVAVTRQGWATSSLRIPVVGVEVHGETVLACALELRPVDEAGVLYRFPAEVIARDGSAWVQASVRAWPGRYTVQLHDTASDRTWGTTLVAVIGRSWRLTVRRAKKPPTAKSLWASAG